MKSVKLNNTVVEVDKGDITEEKTDAIVNAANNMLAPGGGVAGAIHKAAGPDLYEECKKIAPCATGEAKITKGYRLKAKFVIHTVGPVYGKDDNAPLLLKQCYVNSLKLADENKIKSISFPAISTGIFGYPVNEAADISLNAVKDYIKNGTNIEKVRFVLYNRDVYWVFENIFLKVFGG